jgi:type VI secretion system secreted protein VgrG
VVLGFDGVDGAQFEDKSGSSYPQLEYTVQYQETDLNFIRRLMEEFGINFHIEMREATQVLVLTDATDDFARPVSRRRSFQPGSASSSTTEVFDTWIAQRHLTTGAVRMTDYNFRTPTQDMQVSASQESSFSPAVLESYEHPGRYPNTGIGGHLALRRLDALRGADQQAKASGHAPSLGAGMRFTLDDDCETGVGGEYAVIAATHHYFGGNFGSGGGGEMGYHGEYTVVPTSLPIAPDRVTPRPFLRGPQSAVVTVGADGDVDEHGRIKVRFPWDAREESMYCRVSQLWAGPNWGAQFIPRTGMEVLVDFMEGDPDRPVIVGCLYNETNRYPGSLPEKKTTSGIKTNSVGGDGHNALIFEDKSGSEEVFIHAQKDLMIKVLDRELVEIGGDSKRTISGKSDTIVTEATVIQSDASIELKVGSSSIKIEPSKITIKSPAVTVEAMGQLEAKGTITKLSATTQLTVQAAIVMIN